MKINKEIWMRIAISYMIMLLMIFSLFALLYGISVFWRGFHNIDLGANYFIVSTTLNQYNITIGDIASDDKFYSHFELYNIGVKQLHYSFWIIIISSISLGVSLITTIFINREKK